jgi:hypothetical protein
MVLWGLGIWYNKFGPMPTLFLDAWKMFYVLKRRASFEKWSSGVAGGMMEQAQMVAVAG